MSDTRADQARDDQTGRFEGGHARPLSPHLQVWRWHVTMLGSILHRMSGVALYGGVVVIMAWLVSLASGPEAYGRFAAISSSPLGLLVWLGLSWSLLYHLAAGIRHLIWDFGHGLAPKVASRYATLSLWFSILATAALWIWLFMEGRVSL